MFTVARVSKLSEPLHSYSHVNMDFSAIWVNNTPKEIGSDFSADQAEKDDNMNLRNTKANRPYSQNQQPHMKHTFLSLWQHCYTILTTEGSIHLYAGKLKGVRIKSKLIFWQQFKTHTLLDKNLFSKNVFRQVTGGLKDQILSVILLSTLCYPGKPLEKGQNWHWPTLTNTDLMLSVANLAVFRQMMMSRDDSHAPLKRRSGLRVRVKG